MYWFRERLEIVDVSLLRGKKAGRRCSLGKEAAKKGKITFSFTVIIDASVSAATNEIPGKFSQRPFLERPPVHQK